MEKVFEQVYELIEKPCDDYQWYALFCANGKEFKIRDQIAKIREHKKNIKQIWIPSIVKLSHTNKNKEQLIHDLLVSGYLFVLMNPEKDLCKRMIEIEDVYYFLWKDINGHPTQIPYEEITKMELGVNKIKKFFFAPHSKFKERDHVRIMNGIFKNLKGYVKEIRKNCIIIDLEEDVIHRKLSVMVSTDNLEKLL